MNLRRQRPNDSLDMLLDTMCNTFGGIILLAVLVTLLTSRERHSSGAPASDTREMMQRRLVLAETNLLRALELQASLQSKANDGRWKSQLSLVSQRKQLEDEIKTARELAAQNAKELDAAASLDPAERMKDLNAQLATARAGKVKMENSMAAAKQNIERLKGRLSALEKQVADRVADSQRALRLPKEHETGRRPIYVIGRYGRIFLCRNADLSRNDVDINWTSTGASDIADPKIGRGIDPSVNAGGLGSYFRRLSANSVYIAFCVFEDSFPAFIRAKQLAIEAGLSYGWEPFLVSDGRVVFSSTGHVPKPQ